jgi:hypothetical protein
MIAEMKIRLAPIRSQRAAMIASTESHLTIGIAATRIGGGVQPHHLDRLAKRGLIPHSSAGRFRLVAVADLDAIREACVKAGAVDGITRKHEATVDALPVEAHVGMVELLRLMENPSSHGGHS